ncbi:hypothetical protein [Schaalia hyovaginalis]|uniref:Membrane protein n=1 Tax=Schaalia hyovaginalis TaxID=29316 RepID=A0A923E0G1_9ACTO|nr:hypothetical protein [Schaalia hyovaginalis]MBB6333643.1 putative membrane protein [Schaalia hyovaginalis]
MQHMIRLVQQGTGCVALVDETTACLLGNDWVRDDTQAPEEPEAPEMPEGAAVEAPRAPSEEAPEEAPKPKRTRRNATPKPQSEETW